jgi:hypothetical protein
MGEVHQLFSVDPVTGEATSECPDCLDLIDAIKDLKRSYRSREQALKKELEKERGRTPDSVDVELVFRKWAETVVNAGFWSRPPKYTAGRWEPIEKRLKQGYDVDYLLTVIESIRFSREDVKQAWLEPAALFGEPSKDGMRWGMEARYENVVSITQGRRIPSTIPERVLRDFHFEPLLEECECGHLRLEHSKSDPFLDGFQPCLVPGCYCTDFDTLEVLIERAQRKRAA